MATPATGNQIPTSLLFIIAAAVFVIGLVAVIAVLCSRKDGEEVTGKGSYFDGNTFQLIGYRILMALVTTVTFGIAYPWMLCTVKSWEVKHTVINGRRLKFTGHGHQLIGKYLLWLFLTVITFGIYSIWLGLGVKKWVVKHTAFADEQKPIDSYFSGGAGGYLGIHLLSGLLSVVTLGIGRAWAQRMVLSWETKHTHIGGSPMEFNGTGGQLFVKYLLLAILTPLTLGIYVLFFTVSYLKWQTKHTAAVYCTDKIQSKARMYEATAVQDCAHYRIAAGEQELAALRSGFTGHEDAATLERMAAENNPFALHLLSKMEKGENTVYEGKALHLLQRAAEGKNSAAMLELAKQLPPEEQIAMLSEAAQYGNAEASWLLAQEYQSTNELAYAVYWYKVALEWGIPAATTEEYEAIVDALALQYAENCSVPKQSPVVAIVLGIVGAFVLIAALAMGALILMAKPSEMSHQEKTEDLSSGWNIQEVYLVQSRSIDQIRGEELDALDYLGNPLHYIFDQNVFFDYEQSVLYFEFGVIEYDFPIYLTDKVEWQTEPITANGIFMASYPYDMPPQKLAVMGETFISSDDTANITVGTSAEAEKWLEERYTEYIFTEPTEEPSTEAVIADELLWGDWVCYEYTYAENVFMTEFGMSFYSDGRSASYSSDYENYGIDDGNPNVSYVNGDYWTVIGGGGQSSTYYLEGDLLHVTTEASVQYGEAMHYTYQIRTLTKDTLELINVENGLLRTYTKAN